MPCDLCSRFDCVWYCCIFFADFIQKLNKLCRFFYFRLTRPKTHLIFLVQFAKHFDTFGYMIFFGIHLQSTYFSYPLTVFKLVIIGFLRKVLLLYKINEKNYAINDRFDDKRSRHIFHRNTRAKQRKKIVGNLKRFEKRSQSKLNFHHSTLN